MHRVLRYWALLFPAFLVADQFTALVGFHHVDLTFERFFAITIVPLAQAVLLVVFFTPSRRESRLLTPTVDRWTRRFIAGLVVADLVLLELAWWPAAAPFTRADRFAVLRLIIAVHALAAAVVALRLAAARASPPRQRTSLVVLAVVFAGTGVSGLVDWIGALSALLAFALPEPAVRLLVATLAFAVGVASVASLQQAWEGRRPLAARLLDWALAGAVALALVVILNRFWHPTLPPFWSRVADSLALAVVVATLAAFVVVWRRWEEESSSPTAGPAAATSPRPLLPSADDSWLAVAAIIAGSYLLLRLGGSFLVTGSARWGLESTVLAVVVPASQIALLAIARAYRRHRSRPEAEA